MVKSLSPLRLPVRTESGQQLGAVVDVSIDPDTGLVVQYHVKPSRLVPDMVWSPLLIHHSQVLRITVDGVIVDDAATRQSASSPRPQPTA